jgi:hypothetical protein
LPPSESSNASPELYASRRGPAPSESTLIEALRLASQKLPRILRKWECEIERSEFAPKPGTTFAAAALAYMKAGGDRRPLTHLLNHFGETHLRG